MKNLSLLVPVIFLLSACVNKAVYFPRIDQSEAVNVAFVSLRIAGNDSGYAVSILDSKVIEGSLKSLDPKPSRWIENDFYCLVSDKKGHIADSLIIAQPLHPRYEFPEEDGTIGTKTVELKENEVLLRFRYRKPYRYLRIGIVEGDNHFRFIDTIYFSFKK